MSSPFYISYARYKSRTMFGLCVLFTVGVLVVLGLVTGFLTFKGYKGVLARPRQIRATVLTAPGEAKQQAGTDRGNGMALTVATTREDGQAVDQTFRILSNTIIIIDGSSEPAAELKAGMTLDLRYTTADPTTAVTILSVPRHIDGTVTAVEKDRIVLKRPDGAPVAYAIAQVNPASGAKGVNLTIGDKRIPKLEDLSLGSPVRLEFSAKDADRVITLQSPIPVDAADNAEGSISRFLPPILTRDAKPSRLERYYPGGMRNGIVGTLILIALASIVGIPLGVLAGIYLAEYSSNSFLANPLRFVADVLTGVPSIVVGILGYELLVRRIGRPNGWAGALALAFIMIPLVARTTEEMLLLVPRSYREASIALGATKARTILKVVIPAATGSVITGIMLAIARVAGETAPLLFTVVGLDSLEWHPGQQFPALTLQIYKDAMAPDDQLNQLAWAGILILLAIIFILNVVVRSTAKAMSRARMA